MRSSVELSPSSSTKHQKMGLGGSGDLVEVMMKYLRQSSNDGFMGADDDLELRISQL